MYCPIELRLVSCGPALLSYGVAAVGLEIKRLLGNLMTTSSLPTGKIDWRYLVAGRVRFPIEPILLIVSLTTLCFVFIVVFSDSDNAARLFVGGDGAYVRTLVRQQYDWFGLRAGNLMNFWQ